MALPLAQNFVVGSSSVAEDEAMETETSATAAVPSDVPVPEGMEEISIEQLRDYLKSSYNSPLRVVLSRWKNAIQVLAKVSNQCFCKAYFLPLRPKEIRLIDFYFKNLMF